MIDSVVQVSGVHQSDLVIHTHVSALFQVPLPCRLLQSTEQHFLCYTVSPCWLSILNTAMCSCKFQTPNLPLTLPLGNHKFF